MCLRPPKILVRHYVVAWRTGITCFIKCDYYGHLWILILEWLGNAMVSQGDVIFDLNHFGGLGGLPLFGLRFYLLSRKIVTTRFSIIRWSLKMLSFKHICGWKRILFCLISTTCFGGYNLSVARKLLCNATSIYFFIAVLFVA